MPAVPSLSAGSQADTRIGSLQLEAKVTAMCPGGGLSGPGSVYLKACWAPLWPDGSACMGLVPHMQIPSRAICRGM